MYWTRNNNSITKKFEKAKEPFCWKKQTGSIFKGPRNKQLYDLLLLQIQTGQALLFIPNEICDTPSYFGKECGISANVKVGRQAKVSSLSLVDCIFSRTSPCSIAWARCSSDSLKLLISSLYILCTTFDIKYTYRVL